MKHDPGRDKVMMGERERAKVREILDAAAERDGVGNLSAMEVAMLLDLSVAWTDVQWLSMAMQLGVLPTKD